MRIIAVPLFVALVTFGCRGDGHAGAGQQPKESSSAPDLGPNERWHYLLADSPRTDAAQPWDGRYRGHTTIRNVNGTKRSEGNYRNTTKEGSWTYWYENGAKRWEGSYVNGRPEGPEAAWYENGVRFYEGAQHNGLREGWFTFWHSNGAKWFEGEYREDLKEGYFRYWHASGAVDSVNTGTYLHGRRVSD